MDSEPHTTLAVGVFIPADCQLLDAASVDIFGTLSHEYLAPLMGAGILPSASAPSVTVYWIGGAADKQPIPMTSKCRVLPTHHFSDPEVAPGKLDIVLVPGADPTLGPAPADAVDWLKRQGETPGVDVLSVCSGLLLCGQAGLVRGRRACGPRDLQDFIRSKGFGEKELVGDRLRWVQDGNLWSSGAITNGNDLVVAYCRADPKRFPRPLVDFVCEVVGVGDRPQEYTTELMDGTGKKLSKLVGKAEK
ncbi:class I glutamine amidotransferase-like protein [Xylariomycetidae sp. FL0641]|nr:class I glutamine amidotransferase-like protein [Xylariomycetidae sp. FL0641]